LGDKLKVGAESPDGLKLAYRFWIDLGRPPRWKTVETLKQWASSMECLLKASGVDYHEFREFLMWALRNHDRWGNPFTAGNLRIARDPMASLTKQLDTTWKFFEIKKRLLEHPDYAAWLAEQETEQDLELEKIPDQEGLRAMFAADRDMPCEDCQSRPYRQYEGQMLCYDCYCEATEPSEGTTDLQWGNEPDPNCRDCRVDPNGICWKHDSD
jgi:hypothetical protein